MRRRIFTLFLVVSTLALVTIALSLWTSYRFQRLYDEAVEAHKRWETRLHQTAEIARVVSNARSHVFDPNMDAAEKARELDYSMGFIEQRITELKSSFERDQAPAVSPIWNFLASAEAADKESEALLKSTHGAMYDISLDRALGRLEWSLANLQEEIARTQTDMLAQDVRASRRARTRKILAEGLGGLSFLVLMLYGRRLHGQMKARDEESTRLYQELCREREQLETRVAERTEHLQVEIQERERAEAYNRYRNEVLEQVLASMPIESILQFLAEVLERQVPGARCTVLRGLSEGSGPGQRVPIRCFDSVVGYFVVEGADPKTEHFAGAADFASAMAALATEHDQLRSQLSFRADHDVLTSLPNRRLGMQRLSEAVERMHRYGKVCALISIDLDKFKEVNDSFGHVSGDAVLVETAARLRARLRAGDTLARVGGDEFMIVLEQVTNCAAAESVAHDLIQLFEEPFEIGGRPILIGISMGIAVCTDAESTAAQLCREADDAMYLAKARGRNQYQVHTAELSHSSEWRYKMAENLRRALANSSFRLLYQGQYSITGELIGVEALLRFRDGELAQISPAEFLPVAEEFGLIHQIGDWVLKEVCRQICAWKEQGERVVPVSVNVSRTQFSRAEFVPFIARLLATYDVDAALIELEITENAVMQDVKESARQIAALKAMGISVAIDDFGTGYSSLSSLRELPVDRLKLDRSFVQNMQDEGGTLPIVEAALYLAKSFGLQMVAEGVETSDQLALLAGLGCESIQGFLMGRPVPADEIRRGPACPEHKNILRDPDGGSAHNL